MYLECLLLEIHCAESKFGSETVSALSEYKMKNHREDILHNRI